MRVRLIATVALLVLLALAGAGAIVYAVEGNRIEERTLAEIDQELGEFRAFQAREPDAGVRQVLVTFLQRNVPDDNEVLVAYYGDRPRKAFPSGDEYVSSAAFARLVAAELDTNGATRVQVPSYGDALVTVQGVGDGTESGALVIVTYLELDRAELRDTMRTYAIVALLSLLLITAVAAWLSGRLLAPLRTLRETAQEITESDLSRRIPESGNDDITALTRTVNGMLDRLEAAFVGQREFLDDAGHELKTPLTVLRGHLEVLDSGDPADVAETRALLLDETDRMSRLVGDLILLAKSRRPDFLHPRSVGVDHLTHTLLTKARVLGDRDWQLDGTADVLAPLDEQRVTQAVLQLVDNAVKHTSAGDTVALGSAHDAGSVRLWVRDTGPGVPEHDREHVFERFGRSEVPAGDEGFGLGLSIVRAIAEAHGGSVAVEPVEPRGARFVMTLPRSRPVSEEDPWPAS